MPVKNMGTALELYQPSSAKGVMLKKVLPVITQIPLVGMMFERLMNIVECEMIIPYEVEKVIYDLFGKKELTLSYFSGTPSVHQKEIIQVASNNTILGYVKYSSSREIKNIFRKESLDLAYLNEKLVCHVPNTLICLTEGSGLGIFVQDTKKTKKSTTLHYLDKCHLNFLKDLAEKTKVKILFKDTDYNRMLKQLRSLSGALSYLKPFRDSLNLAIDLVEKDLNSKEYFSFYHGDFTPWNTFLLMNDIYSFDFEYASRTYPMYLDVFHFFTQTLLFEKRLNSEKIFAEFEKLSLEGFFSELFLNEKLAYIEYLLSVICLFANRDGETINNADLRNMVIWIDLVQRLAEIS